MALLNSSSSFPNSSSSFSNSSSFSSLLLPPDRIVLDSLYSVLYKYALPSICVFGSLGNVLNLLILTGKRIQHSLRSMERSANVGLIALAVADLSFCLSVFPSTFLPQDMVFHSLGFLTYYGCYCAAVINIFIMTSTWLTVAMSMERYLAICHPLKSRNFISLGRTKAIIVLVYLLSVIFNLPVFWRYIIVTSPPEGSDNATIYKVLPRKTDETFEHAYRGLWSGLGNLVPLALLLLCNVALTKEIHSSYALRRRMKFNVGRTGQSSSSSSSDQESSHRITVTLVCIVLMFFLLVAPSEMLKQIAYLIDGGDTSHGYTYMVIELVTNLMQTINFSANFILYCIINPSFRKTMWKMIGFRRRRLRSTSTADDVTFHGLAGVSLARADSQFQPGVGNRSRATSLQEQQRKISMMRKESAL